MSNVYELPKATLADVPRVLRAIADEIEAGAYGEIDTAVVVLENKDGVIEKFGAGCADYYRAIAVLTLAAHSMCRERFVQMD